MTTYYWVGGTGTFATGDTTHWSLSSGGASGAGPPATTDDVIFNASSGGGAVNFNARSVKSLTATGFTGSISGGGQIAGNFTLGSGMSSISGTWTLAGTGTQTLTSAGLTIPAIVLSSTTGGTYTLQDNLTCSGSLTSSSVSGTRPSINFNNHNVSCTSMSGAFDTFTGGSGTLTLTASGAVFSPSANTWSTASLNIKLTDSSSSSKTFNGGNRTYNNFWFAPGAGTGTLVLNGSNVFNDFKDDGTAAHQITFPNKSASTTTVTTFTVNGNSGALISLRPSSGIGSPAFSLICASGTINCTYLNLFKSQASGGATWNADSNSVDAGSNTGWIFATSTQTLLPALISFSQSFPSAVITTTVGMAASLFTNTSTFYSPVVLNTTQFLTASLLTNTNIFYTPTMGGSGNFTLTPILFTNTNTFYTPVRSSINALTPAKFTNTNTFYSAGVAFQLLPSLFINSQTFYVPALGLVVLPGLFTNVNVFMSAATDGVQKIFSPPPTTRYFLDQQFFSPTIRHTAPAGDGNRPMRIVNGKATFFR